MSQSRLYKRAGNLAALKGELSSLTRHPILISDSKALTLRNNFFKEPSHPTVRFPLEVWASPGFTTKECVDTLERQIEKVVTQHSNVIVYIWAGTCDLSRKTGKVIDIRTPQSHETFREVCAQYRRAIATVNRFGDAVVLRFLDCPLFSPSVWNITHGTHTIDPKILDNEAIVQCGWLNEYIHKLNNDFGYRNINFNNDFVNCRRSKGKRSQYAYNTINLYDGVHPDTVLSHVWCVLIIKDLLSLQHAD